MPAVPEIFNIAADAYMYAYSLYLFFDFAGYTAFAVGVSYIMGIKSPENFNKPFISRNIKDFWNRWHMSYMYAKPCEMLPEVKNGSFIMTYVLIQ